MFEQLRNHPTVTKLTLATQQQPSHLTDQSCQGIQGDIPCHVSKSPYHHDQPILTLTCNVANAASPPHLPDNNIPPDAVACDRPTRPYEIHMSQKSILLADQQGHTHGCTQDRAAKSNAAERVYNHRPGPDTSPPLLQSNTIDGPDVPGASMSPMARDRVRGWMRTTPPAHGHLVNVGASNSFTMASQERLNGRCDVIHADQNGTTRAGLGMDTVCNVHHCRHCVCSGRSDLANNDSGSNLTNVSPCHQINGYMRQGHEQSSSLTAEQDLAHIGSWYDPGAEPDWDLDDDIRV